jgi:uncharacterized 2Fe-2S/4Fe-4S cluster protein (DUF4445 family)
VLIDAPCGGNGTCGKCRLHLLDGAIEGGSSTSLSERDFAAGWRLACMSTVGADARFELPDTAVAWQSGLKVVAGMADDRTWQALQTSLKEQGLYTASGIRDLTLTLSEPSADDVRPDGQRLIDAVIEQTGALDVELPASVLRELPGVVRESNWRVRCLIAYGYSSGDDADGIVSGTEFDGESGGGETAKVISVFSADESSPACVLACDIGTTSVSATLLRLSDAEVLAQASAGNAQIRYGADVINRIIAQNRAGGVERMRRAIVEDTLNPLIAALCATTGISAQAIALASFAGNTTMNHLLLGVSAEYLRRDPFVPCFFSAPGLSAGELGLTLPAAAPVSIAPNVGSYVGGDITAGVMASGLWSFDELMLFVDLGTNGELVFGNREFLLSCACSAGPAFEGGDISCGMRATNGAIEALSIDDESLEPTYAVIGDEAPLGLCGSGLIDLISELMRTGIIDGRGAIVAEGPRVRRDAYGIGSYVVVAAAETASGVDIAITEVDIDNFIRAKAAIFSAIMVMLDATGFGVDDISRILVAGGIGSGIDIDKATAIGLFPKLGSKRFSYIGNSSLAGARAMAVSRGARELVEQIASNITYLELSTTPGYMDAFIAACFLPHTDQSLFA